LGGDLAIKLANKTKQIRVSSRVNNKNIQLQKENIEQYLIDIQSKNYDNKDFFNSDILIINIPYKNIDAFKYLINKIENSNIKKVIFISSTSIYDDTNNIINEDDNCENKTKELYIIEKMFFENKSFLTTSLRLSGLIGYSRHPGNFFKNKIVKNSKSNVNLIHRDDCVNIIIEVVKQNIWNEKFNCTASTHPTRKEFYTYASGLLSNTLVFEQSTIYKYKIISNDKVKSKLNYDFVYDDLMKIIF